MEQTLMVAEMVPERSWKGPGCDDRCHVLKAVIPGVFGRSELLLHDAEAHEDYGRFQAGASGGSAPGHTVVTGQLSVNLGSLEVSVNGASVRLTATELRLLCALARRVGMTVSLKDLVSLVWEPAWVGAGLMTHSSLITTNVCRLRAKLAPAGGLVVTLPGIGLRLDVLPPGSPPRFVVMGTGSRPAGQWAMQWVRCRACDTTDRDHKARGFCSVCYEAVWAKDRWLEPAP